MPRRGADTTIKGSCACCRLRTSRDRFCRGCRRVVCPGCSRLTGGHPSSHQLTDHEGWQLHGGCRPASWGKKQSRRGAGSIPSAPRQGPLIVSSCAQPWHKLFKPTAAALLAAGRSAAAMLTADAVGGTD